MGNTIHVANKLREKIYVVVAPDTGWAIADLCAAGASLLTGLNSVASAAAAAGTIDDVVKISSLIAAIKAVSFGLTADTLDDALNAMDAFKSDAIEIGPGDYAAVAEKTTENPLNYLSPSGWAAISGASDMALLILSESGRMFASFSSNSDHSWVVTTDRVVRARYGKIWVEDAAAGWKPWEGTYAGRALSEDGHSWPSALEPLAAGGWRTRHPVSLQPMTGQLWGAYVGVGSDEILHGRAPIETSKLAALERIFHDEWETHDSVALTTYGDRIVAGIVGKNKTVYLGYYDNYAWHVHHFADWQTEHAVALVGLGEDIMVAHTGLSGGLHVAYVRLPSFELINGGVATIPDFTTKLAPTLATDGSKLAIAAVREDGAACVFTGNDGSYTRLFGDWTTASPLGLAYHGGELHLSFIGDIHGGIHVARSSDGKTWASTPTRILSGYLSRNQAPLCSAFGKLVISVSGVPTR